MEFSLFHLYSDLYVLLLETDAISLLPVGLNMIRAYVATISSIVTRNY